MKSATKKVFKIKLKVGDTVIVRSGKYKDQQGKIISVHPTLNKVTVEGINIAKKHIKPTKKHPQGGIIDITRPIWVSKLGLIDPVSKKATKISYSNTKDGKKQRIYAKSKKEVK